MIVCDRWVVILITFLNGFEGILLAYIYPMIPTIQTNEIRTITSLCLKLYSIYFDLKFKLSCSYKLYILEQDIL